MVMPVAGFFGVELAVELVVLEVVVLVVLELVELVVLDVVELVVLEVVELVVLDVVEPGLLGLSLSLNERVTVPGSLKNKEQ